MVDLEKPLSSTSSTDVSHLNEVQDRETTPRTLESAANATDAEKKKHESPLKSGEINRTGRVYTGPRSF